MTSRLRRDFNAHRVLFDPDNLRPIYIGFNESKDATTSASGWGIFRFVYNTTTTDKITEILEASGIYDDRTTILP